VGHVDVEHLLGVRDLAVDRGAEALARVRERPDDHRQILRVELVEDRVDLGQHPLELEAAERLLDRVAVLQERLARVARHDEVDELLAEERLGADDGLRLGGNALAVVDAHLDHGPAVDERDAAHLAHVDATDLDVGTLDQALASRGERALHVVAAVERAERDLHAEDGERGEQGERDHPDEDLAAPLTQLGGEEVHPLTP
jgi:hypothetical protein